MAVLLTLKEENGVFSPIFYAVFFADSAGLSFVNATIAFFFGTRIIRFFSRQPFPLGAVIFYAETRQKRIFAAIGAVEKHTHSYNQTNFTKINLDVNNKLYQMATIVLFRVK